MSQRAVQHESREQVGEASGHHLIAPARSQAREQASVQQYFDRYAKAMTTGDTKAMVKLWGVPAFVIGEYEARVVQSESEVEQFLGGAAEMYTERGIVDTRAEIVDLDWITSDLVIATVRWPYLDAQERTVGEETSSYTLLRGEDGSYKLRVVTCRGEAAQGLGDASRGRSRRRVSQVFRG